MSAQTIRSPDAVPRQRDLPVPPCRRLSVFGAGAWGTALALHFSSHMATTLWSIEADHVGAMRAARRNDAFFPGFSLPDNLIVTADLDKAFESDVLLVALPTAAIASFVDLTVDRIQQPIVLACKGFIVDDGAPMLPFQYVEARIEGAMGSSGQRVAPVGVLSGPSFAKELAQGKPTAVSLAFDAPDLAAATARRFHTAPLRVYSTTDRVGVSVGGAVKNPLAIATGVCDGMALGANARAALITRGLAEVIRFGVALGARADTFSGLAGVGDLLLTTTGDLSRNRQVGLMLAEGRPLDEILSGLGHVAEGVGAARILADWSRELGVDMPICAAVHRILQGRATPAEVLADLLARDPRSEEVS